VPPRFDHFVSLDSESNRLTQVDAAERANKELLETLLAREQVRAFPTPRHPEGGTRRVQLVRKEGRDVSS